jgi:hypothetical protein
MNQVEYGHIDWTSMIFQEMLCELQNMQSIDDKVKIVLMDTQKNQEITNMVIE